MYLNLQAAGCRFDPCRAHLSPFFPLRKYTNQYRTGYGLLSHRLQVHILPGLLTNLKASFLYSWRFADFFQSIILILYYHWCCYLNQWRIINYPVITILALYTLWALAYRVIPASEEIKNEFNQKDRKNGRVPVFYLLRNSHLRRCVWSF